MPFDFFERNTEIETNTPINEIKDFIEKQDYEITKLDNGFLFNIGDIVKINFELSYDLNGEEYLIFSKSFSDTFSGNNLIIKQILEAKPIIASNIHKIKEQIGKIEKEVFKELIRKKFPDAKIGFDNISINGQENIILRDTYFIQKGIFGTKTTAYNSYIKKAN